MAWTDSCKIDFVKQIEHKQEQGVSVRQSLRILSEESGISIHTLNRWLYPRKQSVVENDVIPSNNINNLEEGYINTIEQQAQRVEEQLIRTNIHSPSEPAEIDEIDQDAKSQILKQATVIRKEKREEIIKQQETLPKPELPEGEFDLIYTDPPWKYEFSKSDSRIIENQYPTMTVEEIKAMKAPASDDCILFLWTTSPKLEEAIEVINAWGFTYKTCAVWDKEIIGMGYYFRQQHELLLIATKGSPGTPLPEDRVSSVINSRREEHSKKPDIVYEIIEKMYPNSKKLEMFARQTRTGWGAFGNEI